MGHPSMLGLLAALAIGATSCSTSEGIDSRRSTVPVSASLASTSGAQPGAPSSVSIPVVGEGVRSQTRRPCR